MEAQPGTSMIKNLTAKVCFGIWVSICSDRSENALGPGMAMHYHPVTHLLLSAP